MLAVQSCAEAVCSDDEAMEGVGGLRRPRRWNSQQGR